MIGEQEEAVLLTSLIYAADKVANTCGQYDAFLKHLGAAPYAAGRHAPGGRDGLQAAGAGPAAGGGVGGRTGSLRRRRELIDHMEADVLYLDPPYNGRQYIDNYHVLENIARWEKPRLYGKTRKFARDGLKSAYSRRASAGGAPDPADPAGAGRATSCSLITMKESFRTR